jgi:diadenosine tetraphosphate (Ap4A) HIT family hydrolase
MSDCNECFSGCVFCDAAGVKTEHHIIVKDKYPVSRGHLLVVPKRHLFWVSQYERHEWEDLQNAIKEAKEMCSFASDFNIGVNDGEYAGQTVKHLHWHIIPRTKGDGGKPCGVRNVFPDKADYRKEKDV